MVRYMIIIISFLVVNIVHAAEWIGPGSIERIIVQPNGRIYIEVDMQTPDLGCNDNQPGMLELDTNAPHFKQQFALFMTAHTADRDVTIYVNDCGYYPYASNTQMF